jgi:NAD(P)H-hydrate epimerase
MSDSVTQAIQTILTQADCPIILDADGINALVGHINSVEKAKYPVVLTPHVHEFSRICDIARTEDPAQDAAAFAQAHHCVLLLKGHRTVIAAPDGTVLRNVHGNPGMAKGGSGDVLSGIILSLLGQGLEPLAAAACGAYIHSRAGDLCANAIGEYGMTPTDMLSYIPQVLKPLNSREW